MANPIRGELGRIVSWLLFPLVPVVLADFYYQVCNFHALSAGRTGPDPHDWDWLNWIIMLGPLVGYGFLAGATVDIPDGSEPASRGLRQLLAKRAVWVAIGPWSGFLFCCGLYFGVTFLANLFPANPYPNQNAAAQAPAWWEAKWVMTVLVWVFWVFVAIVVGILACSWLWPARAALRRAARIGRFWPVLYCGLLTALGFVGSLFGSFWAATALWRTYFFDPRIVPLVATAVSLLVLSGCGSPITYGEVRRRELFHAMLVAWVIGLALMWRWWSRSRSGRPGSDR